MKRLIGVSESKIVNVEFKPVKDFPESVRKANNLFGNGFVEIVVRNSEPDISLSEINSPARRVKEILKSENIKVKFK